MDAERPRSLIENALDLEAIDLDLYRSRSLWKPVNARGKASLPLNSFKACLEARYWLKLSRQRQTPSPRKSECIRCIHTFWLREIPRCPFCTGSTAYAMVFGNHFHDTGRSFSTRAVSAKQKGKLIFSLTASFQKPEVSLIEHHLPMPEGIPPPDKVPTDKEIWSQWYSIIFIYHYSGCMKCPSYLLA